MANAQLQVDIITKVAKVAGAAAILAFAKDTIDAASNAEQAIGGVEAVFKDNAQQVLNWSKQSGQAMGLASTDYQTMATLIGSQLKGMGVSMKDLAPKTNDLIQVGADLASMYGGNVSDAVSAVSSLLKGERDPIEKYGVSMTQAQINAKKLEMGLGGLTGAADTAANMQATLALLTQKTADAMGQNAREADTTQGKQMRLAAAYQEAKVAIGNTLIPAYQNLMIAGQKLLAVLEPLIAAVGSLVSWISQLPTPMLAAVAAFALWLKYGKDIVASFSKMKSEGGGLGSAMGNIGKQIAAAGVAAVAGWVIGKVIDGFTEGSKAAEEFKKNTSDLADNIVAATAAGEKWSAASDDMIRKSTESSAGFQTIRSAGISYADAMDLVTGKLQGTAKEKQLLDQVMTSGATDKAKVDALNLVGSTEKLISASTTLAAERQAYVDKEKAAAAAAKLTGDTLGNVAGEISKSVDAGLKAGEAYQKQAEEAQAAADNLTKLAQAAHDAAVQSAQTAADSTGLSVALATNASNADDAKRALDGFNVVLDKLSGRVRPTEETVASFNEEILKIGDAFDAGKSKITVNKKALLDWNVAQLTSTEIGGKAYKALNDSQSAFADMTSAAYSNGVALGGAAKGMSEARKAANSGYKAFLAQAGSMGLNAGEAAKLADKLGIVQGTKITDKDFKLIADDKAAQDKLKKLQAEKVVPVKPVVTPSDNSKANSTLDKTAKERKAPLAAVPEKVNEAVNAFNNAVKARKAPMNAQGQNVPQTKAQLDALAKRRDAPVVAQSKNVGPVQAVLDVTARARQALMNAKPTGTSSAESSLSAVAKPRTAPITAEAKGTSAAAAEINKAAQPRTAEITVVVNAVQHAIQQVASIVGGAKPKAMYNPTGAMSTAPSGVASSYALAAPAPSMFAAPRMTGGSLDRTIRIEVSAPQINITGALDPDAVARQVQRIGTSRARRTSGVSIGGAAVKVML